VTRSGVHVDRIASAWLIAALSTRNALPFVASHDARIARRVRFDMFEASYTHEAIAALRDAGGRSGHDAGLAVIGSCARHRL